LVRRVRTHKRKYASKGSPKEWVKLNDKTNRKKCFDASTNNELEVQRANLRAWNYWGRIWRFEHKNSLLDLNTLLLMKVRALTYQKVYRQIVSLTGEFERKTVLDIGCGTSEYHKWFIRDCERFVGVDISKEMLKLCREDWGKAIDVVAADALHLPFKAEAFDTGMTFQALHHFPNWQKALFEMIRTTKQVIVYEPNGDSIFHRFMHWARHTLLVEQRFKQTKEDYELVEFQAAGFSPARITNFLKAEEMDSELFMFSLVPVSLLQRFFKLSPRLILPLLSFEDLIGKLPIIRNQLGTLLVIGKRPDKSRI
jgi:ubiquinone/menaquinone biosynthesis C-methylase UbiE